MQHAGAVGDRPKRRLGLETVREPPDERPIEFYQIEAVGVAHVANDPPGDRAGAGADLEDPLELRRVGCDKPGQRSGQKPPTGQDRPGGVEIPHEFPKKQCILGKSARHVADSIAQCRGTPSGPAESRRPA